MVTVLLEIMVKVTLSYWLGSHRATEAVTHTMGVVTGESQVVTLLTLLGAGGWGLLVR